MRPERRARGWTILAFASLLSWACGESDTPDFTSGGTNGADGSGGSKVTAGAGGGMAGSIGAAGIGGTSGSTGVSGSGGSSGIAGSSGASGASGSASISDSGDADGRGASGSGGTSDSGDAWGTGGASDSGDGSADSSSNGDSSSADSGAMDATTDGDGAGQCTGTHPLLDAGARFCGVGDCYCRSPDRCFTAAIAALCCNSQPVCGDGGSAGCFGTHPLVDGGDRFCSPGQCRCVNSDTCFPSAQIAGCCEGAQTCY